MRIGLSDDAYQAGRTHDFAVVPATDVPATLLVRYADIEMPDRDAETTLRIHRWDDDAGWTSLDGVVDTTENTVMGSIPGAGLYAAFTTAIDNTSIGHLSEEAPSSFRLHAAYPNPFNPTTTIPFDVAEPAHVRLTIYDVMGRRVALLVDEHRAPGRYEAVFSAAALSSGLYVVRAEMGSYSAVKTLLLVK